MIKCPDNAYLINELIKDFKFTKGAELGVRRGEFSAYLLQENPELKMSCVDLWGESPLLNETHAHDSNYLRFIENTAEYKSRVFEYRMVLDDGANKHAEKELDFVFIDATHTYDAVKNDFNKWKPKVCQGGLISGHDYHYAFDNGGVVKGVQEFCPTIKLSNSIDESLALLKAKEDIVDLVSTCWFIWNVS